MQEVDAQPRREWIAEQKRVAFQDLKRRIEEAETRSAYPTEGSGSPLSSARWSGLQNAEFSIAGGKRVEENHPNQRKLLKIMVGTRRLELLTSTVSR